MSVEGTTRPSAGAVQRLARDVGGEVADLRSALRHALDEADRLEAEGRPGRAAAVLAEQQQLLASVHRRLEERLADAAVERAAEGVLDEVEAAPLGAGPAATAGRDMVEADAGRLGMRLLASTAAALIGVALLLAPDVGGTLSVAGSTSADDSGPHQDASTSSNRDSVDGASPSARTQNPVQPTSSPSGPGPRQLSTPPADDVQPDHVQGGVTARPEDDAPEDDARRPPLHLPVHPGDVASLLDSAAEAGNRDRDRDDRSEASSGSSQVGDLTGSGDKTADRER